MKNIIFSIIPCQNDVLLLTRQKLKVCHLEVNNVFIRTQYALSHAIELCSYTNENIFFYTINYIYYGIEI